MFHFDPPNVTEYEGNFSEFWDKRRVYLEQAGQQTRKGAFGRMTSPDKVEDKEPKKPKAKKQKFDPQRFAELETEIKRLEELRPQVEEEFRTLDGKGKTVRAEKRRERLDSIDAQLETLYDEWLELGERKKSWK